MQFQISDKCHQWCLWLQWIQRNGLKLWVHLVLDSTNVQTNHIQKHVPWGFQIFSTFHEQAWTKWSFGKNWLICHACVTQVWSVGSQRLGSLDLRRHPPRTRSLCAVTISVAAGPARCSSSGGCWPPWASSILVEPCLLWPQRTRTGRTRPRNLVCHATKWTRQGEAYQSQRSCRRPAM